MMQLIAPTALLSAFRNRRDSFTESEQGGMLIFTLFILVLLLIVAGTAVDTMRFESRRVATQNAIDSGVLAASSLTQDKAAEALVKEYVSLAGLDPDLVTVTPVDSRVNNGSLVGRTVSATSDIAVNTAFMNMLGIDRLNGVAASTAAEGIQNIEISLILDISGSMGRNNRLVNLKVAAKQFVADMLDPVRDPGTTTISIVPYNHTVVVGNDLLQHLNAGGELIDISADPKPYPGMLDAYRTVQTESTCVRFYDDQFDTRGIGPSTELDRVSHFKRSNNSYKKPGMGQRWCNENRSEIMTHSNNVTALQTHIGNLTAGGWTGIDNGMKWGTALLDPALSPVLKEMIDDGTVPAMANGRPGQYDAAETQKIVVLMTDGDNTLQRDLKQKYKKGPSPVWYKASPSDTASKRYGDYFVLMPDNPPAKRFFVPGDPDTSSDDSYVSAPPSGALQQDYIALHNWFAVKDIAEFFFEGEDTDEFNAHNAGDMKTEEESSIDDRLFDICDAAKANDDIVVYTIAFEAPPAGQTAMKYCATKGEDGDDDYYFPTSGAGISAVFATIAADIKKLRLTN